ncbi:MAG: metallophosphoesterase [Oscillospiraceae bacterium]|nr:metallophosphoesterase [Oscillospiraceae bacterium]
MRIVVFSDSHGGFHALRRVMEEQPDAKAYLHLGDGEWEMDDLRTLYPDKRIHFVAGNCDLGSPAKNEELLTFGDKKIFIAHGHMYGVKNGRDQILAAGKKQGADIICFGHTHTPFTGRKDGVYLFNPGTVSQDRASAGTSYGVILLEGGGVELRIVKT